MSSSTTDPRVAETREAFDSALFGYADSDVTIRLGREYGAALDADPAEHAKRLRTKARDKDAEAERHMAAEADAAGRAASRRLRQGQDDAFAKSFDREAEHCLALANECFAEASLLNREADLIEGNGFQILGGYSVRAA